MTVGGRTILKILVFQNFIYMMRLFTSWKWQPILNHRLICACTHKHTHTHCRERTQNDTKMYRTQMLIEMQGIPPGLPKIKKKRNKRKERKKWSWTKNQSPMIWVQLQCYHSLPMENVSEPQKNVLSLEFDKLVVTCISYRLRIPMRMWRVFVWDTVIGIIHNSLWARFNSSNKWYGKTFDDYYTNM